jgi:hypothetical protein
VNERSDIQFGQAFAQNLQDDSGYVDLTGATVVFQYRVECGTITDVAASVVSASTGRVSVSGLPVGSFQFRWKVTSAVPPDYYPEYGWDQLIVRAIDECATFELFVSDISRTIFPEGEAENLQANHRKYITDALIDLQQKVPCLRTQHRDRISMADTFTECEASVYSAPRGFIAQIYAVTQDNCCAKRYFQPIDWDEMEQILKDNQNCGRLITPTYYYYDDGYGYVDYPDYGCPYYADSSGATDLRFRPSVSFSAMKDGQLYLFPWLQSNEVLVIEWDGIKRSWKDTDEVQFDREVQDAVEHFLDRRSATREDCDIQRIQLAQSDYDTLVAKQIWQCRKERRIERRQHYFSNCRDYCNASRATSGASSSGGGSISELGDCVVDNYSELRALSTSNCQSVKVLGYASAFDGGGGIFIRLSNDPAQTDNDGNIVVSTFNSSFYWRKWL